MIKISGFLAAIKLTDKSGYPDNGYPDLQTLATVSVKPAGLVLVKPRFLGF